jgi:hypothetical protein
MASSLKDGNGLLGTIAASQGPKAITDWKLLMTYNPIRTIVKECPGRNVTVQDDRKACGMEVWISPTIRPRPTW